MFNVFFKRFQFSAQCFFNVLAILSRNMMSVIPEDFNGFPIFLLILLNFRSLISLHRIFRCRHFFLFNIRYWGECHGQFPNRINSDLVYFARFSVKFSFRLKCFTQSINVTNSGSFAINITPYHPRNVNYIF